MSERGRRFAERWISQNVNPEAYQFANGESRPRLMADAMLEEAQALGITRDEIEEEVGEVVSYVADQMQDRTDEEVWRLVEDEE